MTTEVRHDSTEYWLEPVLPLRERMERLAECLNLEGAGSNEMAVKYPEQGPEWRSRAASFRHAASAIRAALQRPDADDVRTALQRIDAGRSTP